MSAGAAWLPGHSARTTDLQLGDKFLALRFQWGIVLLQ